MTFATHSHLGLSIPVCLLHSCGVHMYSIYYGYLRTYVRSLQFVVVGLCIDACEGKLPSVEKPLTLSVLKVKRFVCTLGTGKCFNGK